MSVRQYIGARYVPRFLGLWNNTTRYEALDVVDNGLGTSYIAKIPTAPGTPLTDTDHWAIYGASSGAIINLQNQINDMNDGSVSGSLQNQINANDADILELMTLKKKRVITIADSYGTGSGGATPFSIPLKSYLGIATADYFPYAEGSLGFNNIGLLGHTAESLLQLHENDITDHDTISEVVFVLGGNDIAYQTGLESAITSCFAYVKSQYPNAKIIVAFSYNQFTKLPSFYRDYIDCIEAYYKYVTENGGCWIDNFMYIMHNYDFVLNDKVHPNTSGGQAIARSIAAYIMGKNCDVKYHKYCTYSTPGGNTANVEMQIDNGIASMLGNFRTDAITLATGVNNIKIGTIATPLFIGIGVSNYAMGYIRTQNGQVLPARVYLYEGDIYLEVYSFSADSLANNDIVYTGSYTAATLTV